MLFGRRFYLVKSRLRGREGGHKIQKMGRRRLWMAPCYNLEIQVTLLFLYIAAQQANRYTFSVFQETCCNMLHDFFMICSLKSDTIIIF